MRIRATAAAAVVSGALALTGAAMPAAQAAQTHPALSALAQHIQSEHRSGAAAFAARPADDDDPMDVTFTNVKVGNGSADVSVGTTNEVYVPYSYTLTANGVDPTTDDFMSGVNIYHGSVDEPDVDLGGLEPTCHVTSSSSGVVVENCKGSVDIDPTWHDSPFTLLSADAGPNFHAIAWALDTADDQDSGWAEVDGLKSPGIQRYSRLTAHASVKSITKNHTLTVTGALTRANWDTNKYGGYTGQAVKLQFRKKGSSTYTTLKTVKTDGHGNLKTTYKATTDGYWRFLFSGTATTPWAAATGAYVDVK